MVESPIPIRERRLLLVEGKDEVNFFGALTRHMKIEHLETRDVGGIIKFPQNLKNITLQSDFEEVVSIGIVRDADDSADSAFDSICSTLDSLKLPVPGAIRSPTPESPYINILIMPPSGEGTGRMLEDLCFASVAEDDPVFDCVNQYLNCLEENGISLRENVIAKAQVHAFLASREEPDKRLGEAAQASYWDWNSPVFEIVKDFLQQVATP